MTLRIAVVVGEPSGDLLGAQLVTALRQQCPNIEVEGVIGGAMIKAGCVQLYSMDILGVMGFIDPIKSLPSILRMRKWLLHYLLQDPPDLFIGIDAPDFNLGVEKILRKAGVPTVHFVSPSVWAWCGWRIRKIKKAVDLMLALFPFEEQYYKSNNVPVKYTGHPTADLVPFDIDKAMAKQQLGFNANDSILAIMPGSRNSEMKHMTPIYLQTARLVLQKYPELQLVMPLVQPAYKEFVEYFRQQRTPELKIKYVIGNSFAVMRAADYALVTSGTATLELMLHNVPMIVAFKTNRVMYEIAKRMVKVRFIALPNLLADASIVAEYIQQNANPKALASGIIELIDSPQLRAQQIHKFRELHRVLRQDAANTAAAAILELIGHDH
jgi:lipid-A-disaccharide synthase